MEHLLIIDDNEDILTQLKWGLASEAYTLHLAKSVDQALEIFRKVSPGVVTLDLGLPPHPDTSEEGFRGLEEMLNINPSAKIIVVTGNDERENALQAIKLGAFDFSASPSTWTSCGSSSGGPCTCMPSSGRTWFSRACPRRRTVAGSWGPVRPCAAS